MDLELAMDLLTARPNWTMTLASCRTSHQVIALAREFIASQPAHDWSLLPRDCTPPKLELPEDVSAFAVILLQREFGLAGQSAVFHYEVTGFFAAASQRLAQLATPTVVAHPFFSKHAYLEAAGGDEA